MKCKIYVAPVVQLQLSEEVMQLLMRKSASHYDAMCRRASEHGGFLFGWNNMVRNDLDTVTATFSELDLTLKLFEECNITPNDSEQTQQLMRDYTKFVRTILHTSNEIVRKFKPVELGDDNA